MCLNFDIKFQNAQAKKHVVITKSNISTSALCVKRDNGVSTNLSVKENPSILLQTALVHLTNKSNTKSVKVRVLFDLGSEKSYLAQRIVDCLELQKIASKTNNVSVFGRIQCQKYM